MHRNEIQAHDRIVDLSIQCEAKLSEIDTILSSMRAVCRDKDYDATRAEATSKSWDLRKVRDFVNAVRSEYQIESDEAEHET